MKKNSLDKVLIVSVSTFLATLLFIKSRPQQVEAREYPIHPEPIAMITLEHAEAPVSVSAEVKEEGYIVEVTDEERDLMARVVMSEASVLPIEGKQAVAQTIVNRFLSPKFPNNITEVCNQPYQYSQQDNGDPDEECYTAVDAALKYEGFPPDMYYFRTGHYHTWAEDYCQIGNTYFSCEKK